MPGKSSGTATDAVARESTFFSNEGFARARMRARATATMYPEDLEKRIRAEVARFNGISDRRALNALSLLPKQHRTVAETCVRVLRAKDASAARLLHDMAYFRMLDEAIDQCTTEALAEFRGTSAAKVLLDLGRQIQRGVDPDDAQPRFAAALEHHPELKDLLGATDASSLYGRLQAHVEAAVPAA